MKVTSNNKRSYQFWGFILICLLILGGGYVYSSRQVLTNNSKTSSGPTAAVPQISAANKSDLAASSQLSNIYATVLTKSGHQIVNINLKDNTTKTIFSDSDEKFKIQWVAGTDGQGNIVAAVTADDPSVNQLLLISSKGDGKYTVTQNNFSSTLPIGLSPDSKSILTASYQNNEPVGFSLYAENLNGDNRRQIVKGESSIISPIFFSTDEIAYAATVDNESSIYLVKDNQKITIYTSKYTVTALSRNNTGLLACLTTDKNIPQSKIISVDSVGKVSDQLNVKGFCQGLSVIGNAIAYLNSAQTENSPQTNNSLHTYQNGQDKIIGQFWQIIKLQ